ncbi:hypothetical protein F2P81_010556 [Scophthalmus maximus]|uniref:Glucagon receptor-like n=1 Tax=Scophthalmus maximus TaxID=52904 RepID=A0A6A4T650_SCOMX|nr:hypothetical protein F2P81_010556 [Scophthalmus maximus]
MMRKGCVGVAVIYHEASGRFVFLQVSSTNSLELVKEKWSSYSNQCLDYLNTTPPATGLVCNRTFDLYACWPDGLPGTTVNVSCPWFLPWYRKGLYAVMWCRGAMVMMQYSVMANNYWLLVEGIYLHSLLVITVFSERKYFFSYLAIGWGAPLIFVLPWITVKHLYENEECWERNINMGYWWIIRSPILFAYLINFFIFIRIIKILMSKLRAHQMRYTDYKFRLAKSTLTLIPLLGIHAILFTFVIDESVPKGSMLRLIRLFCDLLFNSFQGLLVAILYCFVNKEVQSEMLKKWKRWKLGKDIDEEYRHTHSQTPHVKSGSLAAGNLTDDPSGDSPRLNKTDRGLSCSVAPDENRRLVPSYSNGTGKSRPAKARGSLRFSFLPQRGPSSHASTTTEHVCLEERGQCRVYPLKGEDTNV